MITGYDISTSYVGVTFLYDDGSYITSTYCDLTKIKDNILEKQKKVREFIYSLDLSYCNLNYVEDKLSGFSKGFTSQNTLLTLAAFHSVFCWLLNERMENEYNRLDTIRKIHPSTAKAKMKSDGLIILKGEDKKNKTLDFVNKSIKDFPMCYNKNNKPKPYCYDMADSYIIARAGYLSGKV